MNMSYNGGHSYLVRLGFRASRFAKTQPRNKTQVIVLPSTGIRHATASYFDQSIRYFQTDGQTDGASEYDKEDDKSSSKFHQQHHRRTYERKRSDYDNEDASQDRSRSKGHIKNKPNINHYQRLNIEPKADTSAIKSAYYSLSKLYHPDVVGSDDAQASENFRLITESYETLSDKQKRQEYDRELELVSEDCSNIFDTAWRPKGSVENPSFQRRNSNLIFRMKMDQAFEMEKLKNPKKFQAGTFKDYHGNTTLEERIWRIDKQLNTLESKNIHGQEGRDGSDFYRMHMRDTIIRRREGLKSTGMYAGNSGKAPEISPLIALIFAGAIISYAVVNTLFDIDIAADLDSKLKVKQDDDDNPG